MDTELASATAQTAIDNDPKIAAIRQALIGHKVTIPQTAKAMNVTERSVYYAVKRHPVPYVVVFGTRYYEPEHLVRACVAAKNTSARGRGRPPKGPVAKPPSLGAR
jgi:hypothetical protein